MDTATKTRCDVVDLILEWTDKDGNLQVESGDLIVHYGSFEQLATVEIVADDPTFVRYTLAGLTGAEFVGVDELVAVRRYITTEE